VPPVFAVHDEGDGLAVAVDLVALAVGLVAAVDRYVDVAASSRPGITAAAVGKATSAATTPTVRSFTGAVLSCGAEVRRHGTPSRKRGENTLAATGRFLGTMFAPLGG